MPYRRGCPHSARHPRAPRGRLSRPSRPAPAVALRGARREVKSGRAARFRWSKNYSTRRAAGRRRGAVPAWRLRKAALRLPGKRGASPGGLGLQGAKGRWAFARFASLLAGRAGVGDKPGCTPCRERAWSGAERRSRPAGREHARRRPPAGTGAPSGRAGCTMSAASSAAGHTASMPGMLVSPTGRTWGSSGRSCAR